MHMYQKIKLVIDFFYQNREKGGGVFLSSNWIKFTGSNFAHMKYNFMKNTSIELYL